MAADGTHRLHDPKDWVRLEVGHALERKIRVIPVLIENAALPPAESLPPEMSSLLRRQALKLDDSAFDYGVSQLVEALEKELGPSVTSQSYSAGAESRNDIRVPALEERPNPANAHYQAYPHRKSRKLLWIAGGVLAAFFVLGVLNNLTEDSTPAIDPAALQKILEDTIPPNSLPNQPANPVVPAERTVAQDTRQEAPVPNTDPSPAPAARVAAFDPVGRWGVSLAEGAPALFVLDLSSNGTFRAAGSDGSASGNWNYQPFQRTITTAGRDDDGSYFEMAYQIGEFHDGHYHAQMLGQPITLTRQ